MNTQQDRDLMFDFTGVERVDLGSLAWVLTARQMAWKECRGVWVMNLPPRTWRLLHALGLENCFLLFPTDSENNRPS